MRSSSWSAACSTRAPARPSLRLLAAARVMATPEIRWMARAASSVTASASRMAGPPAGWAVAPRSPLVRGTGSDTGYLAQAEIGGPAPPVSRAAARAIASSVSAVSPGREATAVPTAAGIGWGISSMPPGARAAWRSRPAISPASSRSRRSLQSTANSSLPTRAATSAGPTAVSIRRAAARLAHSAAGLFPAPSPLLNPPTSTTTTATSARVPPRCRSAQLTESTNWCRSTSRVSGPRDALRHSSNSRALSSSMSATQATRPPARSGLHHQRLHRRPCGPARRQSALPPVAAPAALRSRVRSPSRSRGSTAPSQPSPRDSSRVIPDNPAHASLAAIAELSAARTSEASGSWSSAATGSCSMTQLAHVCPLEPVESHPESGDDQPPGTGAGRSYVHFLLRSCQPSLVSPGELRRGREDGPRGRV